MITRKPNKQERTLLARYAVTVEKEAGGGTPLPEALELRETFDEVSGEEERCCCACK